VADKVEVPVYIFPVRSAVRALVYIAAADIDHIRVCRIDRDVCVVAELLDIESTRTEIIPGRSPVAADYNSDIEIIIEEATSVDVDHLRIGGGHRHFDIKSI